MFEDDVRAELQRILAFDDMRSSRQMSSFLRFVVEQKLAGRDAMIKQRTIAIGALDRDADFDPRLDPIVRVVAGKLRRTLERYDLSVGASDNLRIVIPKGSYVPQFTTRSASTPEAAIERWSCSVLRTKLHAPPVTPDFVRQPALERLDRYRNVPVTTVSAPAGYGKSTLLSAWIEKCGTPAGWLSLDEDDNDPREFVGGLVSAVRTMFPTAAEGTRAMVTAADLPPIRQLSRQLLNDLNSIDDDFVMVLDDYHVIHEQTVHDLMTAFIRHPPGAMQLVFLTRKELPLSLDRLRGRGQVLELSMSDLRFTPAEAGEFLQKLQVPLGDTTVRFVNERMEGWPAGIRLLAQSLQHQELPEVAIGAVHGDLESVASYLISEVLSTIPPSIAECLLKMSILDRFCDPLCQLLCAEKLQEGAFDDQSPLTWLRDHNLFLIPLDGDRRWFRFHHLFQRLLRAQLEQRVAAADTAALHARVSVWFEREGLIGDGIHHALAAGDDVGAAEICERHRHAELEADRWRNLEKWLSPLPAVLKQRRPELLLTQAWVMHDRHQLREMGAIVEALELQLTDVDDASVAMGELKFFQGVLLFWQGQGEQSCAVLEEARDRVPRSFLRIRGLVEVYLALARQIIGQERVAIEALRDELRISASLAEPLHTRVILAGAFVHTLHGELVQAMEQASWGGAIAEKAGVEHVVGWTRFFRGANAFRVGDLDAAIRHLTPTRADPYVMHTRLAIDGLVTLAMAEDASGQPGDADRTMQQLLEFAQATQDPQHLAVARSGQARLALSRGDIDAAARWARTCDGEDRPTTTMFIWLENPMMTWYRVLIELDSPNGLEQAIQGLARLRDNLESIHNTCQLVDVAVLQSLALHAAERTDDAMEILARAVAMAERGKFTRPFTEPGARVVGLLEELIERDPDQNTSARRLLVRLSDTVSVVR